MASKKRAPTVAVALERIRQRKAPTPCVKGFGNHLKTYVSEGVVALVHQMDAWRALRKFLVCDWGDVDRSTALANNRHTALTQNGGRPTAIDRVYGVYYDRRKTEFWIIADLQLKNLVVLLPTEL